MKKEEDFYLEIPVYISLRNELVKGLSWTDFFKCAGYAAIAVIVLLVPSLFIQINSLLRILAVLVVLVSSVTYYTRMGEINISIKDFIQIAIKFAAEQKHYPYIFKRKEE